MGENFKNSPIFSCVSHLIVLYYLFRVIFLKSLRKIKVTRYLQEEGDNGKNKSKNPLGNFYSFVDGGLCIERLYGWDV